MNGARSGNAGFTLLEVLITIAVVSIGLLAVAGLQAMAKKANYDATQRSTAAALAQGIIERIRANPQQGSSYTGVDPSTVTATSCDPSPTAALSSTQSSYCTPAAVAQANLASWWQELIGAAEYTVASGSTAASANLGGLQNPIACISSSAAAGTTGNTLTVYTVAIAWRGLSPIAGAGSSATDPSSSGCGLGNAAYNPPPTVSSSMTMRRVLVVQAAVIS